jgi:hypothetical protein
MGWEDSLKGPVVLIVEDEPLVRLGAVQAIEDAGWPAPGLDDTCLN